MQKISKQTTTQQVEYSDEESSHKGGTQFKISTELNIKRPKSRKKKTANKTLPAQGRDSRYRTRSNIDHVRYAATSVPPPVALPQSQTPAPSYGYNYNYSNPYVTSYYQPYQNLRVNPSYQNYPSSYYPQYYSPGFVVQETYYTDDDDDYVSDDENKSFFSKFASLFKDSKKSKRRY